MQSFVSTVVYTKWNAWFHWFHSADRSQCVQWSGQHEQTESSSLTGCKQIVSTHPMVSCPPPPPFWNTIVFVFVSVSQNFFHMKTKWRSLGGFKNCSPVVSVLGTNLGLLLYGQITTTLWKIILKLYYTTNIAFYEKLLCHPYLMQFFINIFNIVIPPPDHYKFFKSVPTRIDSYTTMRWKI